MNPRASSRRSRAPSVGYTRNATAAGVCLISRVRNILLPIPDDSPTRSVPAPEYASMTTTFRAEIEKLGLTSATAGRDLLLLDAGKISAMAQSVGYQLPPAPRRRAHDCRHGPAGAERKLCIGTACRAAMGPLAMLGSQKEGFQNCTVQTRASSTGGGGGGGLSNCERTRRILSRISRDGGPVIGCCAPRARFLGF